MEKNIQKEATTQDVSQADFMNRMWVVAAEMQMQDIRNPKDDVRILPIDENEYEKKEKSCPTGGCPPDTKLNKDIWNDMMEIAEKKNLELPNPLSKQEIRLQILPLFRQRFRENKKYEKQDKEGPAFSSGPEFIVKGKDIYFPAFDKTLRQMRADQKKLRPELVDPVADATMELLEAAFENGATYARHVSHNKIDGKDAIRDEITMRIDKFGRGKMEIRNIGDNLSLKEAYDVMKQNADPFIEGHPQEGVFIFTDAPIEANVVHEVLDDMRNSDDIIQPVSGRIMQVAEFVEDRISKKIDGWLKEIEDTYIHDITIPVYMQRLFDMPHEELRQNIEIPAPKIHLKKIFESAENNQTVKMLTEFPASDKDDAALIIEWKKIAETLLHISPKESDELFDEVKTMHASMQEHSDILTISLLPEMPIGAGIQALRLLTLQEEVSSDFEISEFVRNPDRIIEKSSIEFVTFQSNTEKDIIFTFIQHLIEGDLPIEFQGVLPESIDIDTLVTTVEFIHRLDAMPSENRIGVILQEKERVLGQIITLWNELNDVMKSKKREPVEKFSTALMVWMIIKASAYYSNIEFIHALVVKNNNQNIVGEIKQVEHVEEIIQQQPTTWILFAIIWQMTMVLEQGLYTSPPVKTQKKKKKAASRSVSIAYPFDAAGVIYHSHMI